MSTNKVSDDERDQRVARRAARLAAADREVVALRAKMAADAAQLQQLEAARGSTDSENDDEASDSGVPEAAKSKAGTLDVSQTQVAGQPSSALASASSVGALEPATISSKETTVAALVGALDAPAQVPASVLGRTAGSEKQDKHLRPILLNAYSTAVGAADVAAQKCVVAPAGERHDVARIALERALAQVVRAGDDLTRAGDVGATLATLMSASVKSAVGQAAWRRVVVPTIVSSLEVVHLWRTGMNLPSLEAAMVERVCVPTAAQPLVAQYQSALELFQLVRNADDTPYTTSMAHHATARLFARHVPESVAMLLPPSGSPDFVVGTMAVLAKHDKLSLARRQPAPPVATSKPPAGQRAPKSASVPKVAPAPPATVHAVDQARRARWSSQRRVVRARRRRVDVVTTCASSASSKVTGNVIARSWVRR
jgi:hypothetical protein